MRDGEEPAPQGLQAINWRRFAIMASAIITGVALIRLIADQLGVPRGTRASTVVAALSNFFMYMVMGLSTPYVVSGIRPRPLWRRLLVLTPLGAVAALLGYVVMQNGR